MQRNSEKGSCCSTARGRHAPRRAAAVAERGAVGALLNRSPSRPATRCASAIDDSAVCDPRDRPRHDAEALANVAVPRAVRRRDLRPRCRHPRQRTRELALGIDRRQSPFAAQGAAHGFREQSEGAGQAITEVGAEAVRSRSTEAVTIGAELAGPQGLRLARDAPRHAIDLDAIAAPKALDPLATSWPLTRILRCPRSSASTASLTINLHGNHSPVTDANPLRP